MKRFMTVLVLMLVAVSMTYAIDLSAGAGAKASLNMLTSKIPDFLLGSLEESTASSTSFYISPEVFFDATYAEVTLGYGMLLSYSEKYVVSGTTIYDESFDISESYLSISLLGKYPIAMGGLTLFPLIGIEYDMNLTLKDTDGNDLKEAMSDEEKAALNIFWIKGGVGADIKISDTLFIRPKALLGLGLLTSDERDSVNLLKDAGFDYASLTKFKLDLGVYIGYKF